jgi:hypothetical protein
VAVSDPIYANTASDVEKGQYRRPFQYILENGAFANPALAMRDGGRLHFVDGHHRLAALTDLREKAPDTLFEKPGRQRPSAEQMVWIGTHAKGELPL